MNKEVQNKSIRKREYHYLSLKCIYSTNNNKRRLKKKVKSRAFYSRIGNCTDLESEDATLPFLVWTPSHSKTTVCLYTSNEFKSFVSSFCCFGCLQHGFEIELPGKKTLTLSAGCSIVKHGALIVFNIYLL